MALVDVRQGFKSYESWAQDPTPRIGLGLPFFDEPTRGGMAKGEVCMFLAYSSVGKTSLGLNVINANPHMPTVFFSIEMSWRLVTARLAAQHTGTPTWELEAELKAGRYPPQLIDTANRFPLLLGNDTSDISVKEMKSQIMDGGQKLGTPIRLVVIDYLELISGAGLLGKGEQVDKIAQKLQALAKDCDCSVVVLHQVGKGDGSGGHLPLALDSGKYGGHHVCSYVVGAYAPRLNRELTEWQRQACEEEIYLQLLKNRGGMAAPAGIKHRMSTTSTKITPWQLPATFIPPVVGGFQAPLDTVSRPMAIVR